MRKLLLIIFLFSISYCFSSADDSINKKKPSHFLALPFFIKSPETSWGFGAAAVYFFKTDLKDDSLRTSDVNLISLYTLRKQTVIVLGSTIFFPHEEKIFRTQVSFSTYPDEFWGIGNNSSENTKEDYNMHQYFINPQLLYRIHKKLYLGGSIELQNVSDFKYTAGGVFDQQNIIGRYGSFTSGIGLLVSSDTRNNAYMPDKGTFVEANLTRFSKIIGSDFNFTTFTFDLRNFNSAGKNRSIAFQYYMKLNYGNTPIRNLAMLGGSEMMRGYYKARYTDQSMVTLQAELRQFIVWRIGVVGFASTGQVAPAFSKFGLNEFHYAYGVGLRLMVKTKERLNLRADFGFGKHSSGVYVYLKEAF